jgi:hypothetical protein
VLEAEVLAFRHEKRVDVFLHLIDDVLAGQRFLLLALSNSILRA